MSLALASLLAPAAIAASPVDTVLRPEIGVDAMIFHHKSLTNEASINVACPQGGLVTDFDHDWRLRPTMGARAELCMGAVRWSGGSKEGVFFSYGGSAGVCASIGGSVELCVTGEASHMPFPCGADDDCQLATMKSHGFGVSVGDRDSGTHAGFFAMQVQDTDPYFFPGDTSVVGMRFTTTVGAGEKRH